MFSGKDGGNIDLDVGSAGQTYPRYPIQGGPLQWSALPASPCPREARSFGCSLPL